MRQQYKFDLYEALCIEKTATLPEIKTAYRKLALLLHPDMNRSSGLESRLMAEAMRGINESYDILSKQDLRKDYDFMVNTGLRLPKPTFYDLIKRLTGELKPKAQPSQIPEKKKDKTFLEMEIEMVLKRINTLSGLTPMSYNKGGERLKKEIEKLKVYYNDLLRRNRMVE